MVSKCPVPAGNAGNSSWSACRTAARERSASVSAEKLFVELGGHQLQLNAVNTKTLKDAQADPDRYRQLVVRIWGWSAYFVELDKEYQDHLILRQEFNE